MSLLTQASDLEFLQWFYENTEFGPADCDIKAIMKQEFIDQTGMELPDSYAL
jgi:hypothetical protein